MPLTFRKRIRIFPGVYLNVGKKSVSLSTRIGPVGKTWSTSGRHTTSVDLPGALGYRSTTTARSRQAKKDELTARRDAARARRDARRAGR